MKSSRANKICKSQVKVCVKEKWCVVEKRGLCVRLERGRVWVSMLCLDWHWMPAFSVLHTNTPSSNDHLSHSRGQKEHGLGEKVRGRERICLGLSLFSPPSSSLLHFHQETKRTGLFFQLPKDYSSTNSLYNTIFVFHRNQLFFCLGNCAFVQQACNFWKTLLEVDIPVKKVVQCQTVPEDPTPGKTKMELVKGQMCSVWDNLQWLC